MTTFQKIILALTIAILFYFLFFYRPTPPVAPNEKLIEYLEIQRKHADSVAGVLQLEITRVLQMSQAREQRDSADLAIQNRINQSLKSIKSQYEKIPSYTNLSNDSLRRLLAKKLTD